MPLIINCPSCHRQLRLPEELLGRLVKCPTCGVTFTNSGGVKENQTPPRSERDAEDSQAPSRQAPPSQRTEEEYDDEPAPRRRRRAAPDYDEDGRPRRSRDEKPGKVQAISIMMLVGGIWAILVSLSWIVTLGLVSFGICCLWPGMYYSLVLGIMATIKGSALLGREAHLQPVPSHIAVMQIINIINGDIPNCVLGIIALIFLNEPEVRRFFRG